MEILHFPIEAEAMMRFSLRMVGALLQRQPKGEIRDYDVSWSVVLDRGLKSRVCGAELIGIEKENLCSR